MAIASVPLANSQHSFALCQHLMDSVTGMNYSWYLWYCGIRENIHECLKWSSEKYGINIPANKSICQKYRFLLQHWCSTHWRRGRCAIIDTAANHGDSFLPLCPLIPKWMVRELLQKPSNCQFVCNDTDTKNHDHKFLLIAITVISITSATVLCNWDGMASMSTNSFCQSSLIFHKTALVNCQLEWIVHFQTFFSQSIRSISCLSSTLSWIQKLWQTLKGFTRQTSEDCETVWHGGPCKIPNMGFHKICA